MTHSPIAQDDFGRSVTLRRWSPRFGYLLAIVGSAAGWTVVAVLALA